MQPAERKRPFYLVVALLGALALGAHAASSGWGLVAAYRGNLDARQVERGVTDDADRARITARIEMLIATLDAAKRRGWPLSVATMVIGTAVAVFAMRALGGNGGARAALVQLIVVQAGIDSASHWLLRDVERAEISAQQALDSASSHDAPSEPNRAAQAASMLAVSLGLRLLGSALVVVALTRRRSRDFFDAMAAAVEER